MLGIDSTVNRCREHDPAQFLEITNDPANKDLYVRGEQMHTGYVTLNVKVKPFDDLRVRQAIVDSLSETRSGSGDAA